MSKKKPGETSNNGGRYIERGPRGGDVPNPRRINVDRGETLPPTQQPNRTWERVGKPSK